MPLRAVRFGVRYVQVFVGRRGQTLIRRRRLLFLSEAFDGARVPIFGLAFYIRIAICVGDEAERISRAVQVAARIRGPRFVPKVLQGRIGETIERDDLAD